MGESNPSIWASLRHSDDRLYSQESFN